MKNPLVSIIVPVYNVSGYLRQCLDSLTCQTLNEIEIILVNDCSPDPQDHQICSEYAANDPRIKYIVHEKNKGVGGARNTAIENASAEYIGWVDSDDWVEPDMFQRLYEDIKCSKADVSQCYFTEHEESESRVRKLKKYRNNGDIINSLNVLLWNKLFKKSLFTINDVRFPEQISIDDVATMPRLFYFIKSVSRVPLPLYHYRVKRKGGVTANFERVMNEYHDAYSLVKEFLQEQGRWEKDKLFFEKRVTKSLLHDSKRLKNDRELSQQDKDRIVKESLSKSLVFLSSPERIAIDNSDNSVSSLRRYWIILQIKVFIQKLAK